MNKRKPYSPRRRVPTLGARSEPSGSNTTWLLIIGPVFVIGLLVFFARSYVAGANPVGVTVMPPAASATFTPRVPLHTPDPTSTRRPRPSPSPTALTTQVPTQLYTTQSGDTLPALAAHFGVNPNDIKGLNGFRTSATTLASGQLVVIPQTLGEVGPGYKIIPDSELILTGGGTGFNPEAFAQEMGGYLAHYKGFGDNVTRPGGDLIHIVAQNYSLNPRLLMALLEYQSGWVTHPSPAPELITDSLRLPHVYKHEFYGQLTLAAYELHTGYYGWRAGTLTELTFPNGETLRLDPTLNAGTVAVQYFFSRMMNRTEWEYAVSESGLAATYYQFFGDPFARAVDPLLPPDLTQPKLELPFMPGRTWYFSGGPHGAWERGGVLASLDFAPRASEGGCAESFEWATAMAPGLIVRSESGSVLLDLDGDGREATGWVILYLHIADMNRIPAGQFVETGDRIGHPSCEGGVATGTHIHVARKYNGEWIPADGLIPFNLSGWVARNGEREYLGTLTRGDLTVEACSCTSAQTAIAIGE